MNEYYQRIICNLKKARNFVVIWGFFSHEFTFFQVILIPKNVVNECKTFY